MKDRLYRKAYNAYLGVKNESLAWDFWCKGWDAAVEQIRLNQDTVEASADYRAEKDQARHYKAHR
jgi:hypothetical protein